MLSAVSIIHRSLLHVPRIRLFTKGIVSSIAVYQLFVLAAMPILSVRVCVKSPKSITFISAFCMENPIVFIANIDINAISTVENLYSAVHPSRSGSTRSIAFQTSDIALLLNSMLEKQVS